MTTKIAIGIDVSKDTLDYYLSKEDYGQIANEATAICSFLENYSPETHFVTLEPTGTYSNKAIELTDCSGFEIRLVDPKKSHYYSRMMSKYNKTDKIAAQLLSEIAYLVELPLYKSDTEEMKARKQIRMALGALQKQSRMIKSQLHALDQFLIKNEPAQVALKKALETIEQEISKLETALADLDDDDAKEFTRLVTSVTGIGSKTARMLFIYTNGLKYFEDSSKLVKYVGIAPASHSSGSSVRTRAKITKNGPPQLRAVLYMAANAARRFNLSCKNLFDRLRKKGKPFKVAMIAVLRKLLRQCFAVVKSKNLFDNELVLAEK